MTVEKTEIRENIEWTNMRWNDAPDNCKARILLVGDSIVVGHESLPHDIVKDKCCVDSFATKVTEEQNIPSLDLYTPMSEHVEYFSDDAVHYNEQGKEAQAKIITVAHGNAVATSGNMNITKKL